MNLLHFFFKVLHETVIKEAGSLGTTLADRQSLLAGRSLRLLLEINEPTDDSVSECALEL